MNHIKKSSLEISLVRLEIEEAKDIYEKSKKDLESILLKLDLAEWSTIDPDSIPDSTSARVSDKEIDKTLFKMIAKKTHPDVTEDPLRNAYFKEASKSLRDGDTDKLIEICEKISLDIKKHNKKIMSALSAVMKNLCIELESIRVNEFYLWHFFSEDKKVLTIVDMCTRMGKPVDAKEIIRVIRGEDSSNGNELTLTNR
jgi:hypothetical protein